MIELGLATSHASAMFEPKERWPSIYAAMPEYAKESQPHSAKLETESVIEGQLRRTDKAFETLRAQLETYRPDALVMVGDDQNQIFDKRFNPTFFIYTGTEAWGLTGTGYRPLEERQKVVFPCHSELAHFIHKELVKRGFDLASGSVFDALARPERGMSHMVMYPMLKVTPRFDIPIVPIFINEYYPPLPTAERCYQLGEALAQVLGKRSERIAIYASGGLSHDPSGPRAGWVDEPLDRWVLERLERNEGAALKDLFAFDSDTLRGGTGEIRAWVCVAGAMNRTARVLDYIRSHHAKTGLAFAYWPVLEGER